MPNLDSGGDIIRKQILNYIKKDKNSIAFNSLGTLNYLSCMNYVDCVVGNSSSGVIEAPALKKFSVNIGDRQNGRIISETVLTCSNKSKDISLAILDAFKKKTYNKKKFPYKIINTSKRICDIIIKLNLNNFHKKKFIDIKI
jgi:UDP-N-acetylglucosamine 2-epimerase